MKWQDIPKFPNINYRINVPWQYLIEHINRFVGDYNLNMNPDFQRGRVWTEEQQIKYVEYSLMDPQSGKDIYFNHPGWMNDFKGEFVLVDGKQRLTAVFRFLDNRIPAFGCYRNQFTGFDRADWIPTSAEFIFNIAKIKDRKSLLQWYIDFNAGGTPHSKEEIEKVKKLMEGC